MASSLGFFMTEMICMGPQLLETNECLIATPGSIFFIITLLAYIIIIAEISNVH